MLSRLAGAAQHLHSSARSNHSVDRARSYATRFKEGFLIDHRGGDRNTGYKHFLMALKKENRQIGIKEIASRWRALPDEKKEQYRQMARAQSSADSRENKRGELPELPPPQESIVAENIVRLDEISLEGISALQYYNLPLFLWATEKIMRRDKERASTSDITKQIKNYIANDSEDPADAPSVIYSRAAGFALFAMTHHGIRSTIVDVTRYFACMWVELGPEQQEDYIHRALRTRMEQGKTLWQFVSASGNKDRWRLTLIAVAAALQLQSYDDWYKVSKEQIDIFGVGNIVKKYYRDSLPAALLDLMPEHYWLLWKFSSEAPLDYWAKPDNLKNYFKWLSTKLGINDETPEGLAAWYDAPSTPITEMDSAQVLRKYFKRNLVDALKVVYPNHKWLEWRFPSVSRSFWQNSANRKEFFLWLGDQLGVRTMEDWYSVTPAQVRARGGAGLLNKHYRDSLYEALKEIFPSHQWELFRFSNVPPSYWDSVDNQRSYFDWFMKVNNMHRLEDWYHVKAQDIPSRRVLSKHNYSLYESLKALYPRHQWDPEAFGQGLTARTTQATPPWIVGAATKLVGENVVDNKEERDRFISLLSQLGKPTLLESFYSVSAAQLSQIPLGKDVLAPYDGSLSAALLAVFPEHQWHQWLFLHLPANYWDDQNNRVDFLNWLKSQLELPGMNGLYFLTLQDIKDHGGAGLCKMYNESVYDIVKSAFPNHNWQPWRFTYVPKSVWQDFELTRQFIEWFSARNNIKMMKKWYTVSAAEIEKAGGATLLEYYNGSLEMLLESVYPDHAWKPWKFAKLSNGYWKDPKNQLRFFSTIAPELGIAELSDWYKFTTKVVRQKYGVDTLFDIYADAKNPLAEALSTVYPDHLWEMDRFRRSTRSALKTADYAEPSTRLEAEEEEIDEFAEEADEEFGEADTADVTKIKHDLFLDEDEAEFETRRRSFEYNDNEPETVLQQPIRERKPSIAEQNETFDEAEDPLALRRQYITTLGQLLRVSTPEQWRNVTREQLKALDSLDYLDSEGGLAPILREVFPGEVFEDLPADRMPTKPTKQRRAKRV